MSSRLWDVQTALVTLFGGISGLHVFDGPMSRTTPPATFLLVGTDGGDTGADGLEDGGTAERGNSTMGRFEEAGEIVCSAWAWSGGTEFPPLRTAVEAVVDAAEALIEGNPTLGVADVARAELSGLRLRQTQNRKGAFVRAAFTVAYEAHITRT